MNTEIKYIVITGVECSGKSTLCKDLAAYYNEPYVPEMVRSYMEGKEHYTYEDIEQIARLQWQTIEEQSLIAKKYLFIDTAFLVLKIWSEEKYGKCCRFVLDKLASFTPHLYFLPSIDIPYEMDRLREAPDLQERERLYLVYLAHLVTVNFRELSGTKKERLEKAAQYISNFDFIVIIRPSTSSG